MLQTVKVWPVHLRCPRNQTQSCWRTIWQRWKVGGRVAESCLCTVWNTESVHVFSNREFAPVQSSNAFRTQYESTADLRVAHQSALPSSQRSGEKTELHSVTFDEADVVETKKKVFILLLSLNCSFSFLATISSGCRVSSSCLIKTR